MGSCDQRVSWLTLGSDNREDKVPELDTSVFILPVIGEVQTKNGQERVVVLNSIARRVVNEQRGNTRSSFSPVAADRRRAFTTGNGSSRGSGPDYDRFEFTTFVIHSAIA